MKKEYTNGELTIVSIAKFLDYAYNAFLASFILAAIALKISVRALK